MNAGPFNVDPARMLSKERYRPAEPEKFRVVSKSGNGGLMLKPFDGGPMFAIKAQQLGTTLVLADLDKLVGENATVVRQQGQYTMVR